MINYFTIFHTNDMHGRLGYEEYKGTPSSFGSAREKALIDKEKKENPDRTVIALDAGDAFQGLPISNSTKGEARAEILNKMNYDAMAVGNHEFDFGLDEAKKYKQILKFPLLSSNTDVQEGDILFKNNINDIKDISPLSFYFCCCYVNFYSFNYSV